MEDVFRTETLCFGTIRACVSFRILAKLVRFCYSTKHFKEKKTTENRILWSLNKKKTIRNLHLGNGYYGKN